jgi:hypothetical protein
MIYIQAKDHNSAMGVAYRMGLLQDQWRYIMYASDVHGIFRPCVFRVQDYWENKDYLYIGEVLRERQAWIWDETTR